MTNESRAAFEAWALRTQCTDKRDLNRKVLTGYDYPELNAMWVGWKASRKAALDALPVEVAETLHSNGKQKGYILLDQPQRR